MEPLNSIPGDVPYKAFFILCPFLVNAIVMVACCQDSAWYAKINKPAFYPSDSLWMTIPTLFNFAIGYASYLVWTAISDGSGYPCSGDKLRVLLESPLAWLWLHVATKSWWSFVFFRLHHLGLSVLISVISNVCCRNAMRGFRQIDPLAGSIMTVYFVWTTFTFYLNVQLYRKNPSIAASKRKYKYKH